MQLVTFFDMGHHGRWRAVLFCLGVVFASACQSRPTVPVEDGRTSPISATARPSEVFLQDVTFATLPPPTIEIIQQTPTPLPTATPTPTPTPVVYTIKSGDTLLEIAIDHQTTVDNIRTLNPDVRPELLSVGQEIVLPLPATPVFSGEQPTPLPAQIELLSVSLYPDGAGGLWVVGEVQNTADYFLENLRLGIKLYGEAGTVVAEKTIWTAAELIAPDQSTPFALFLAQKPPGNLQAEVYVVSSFAFTDLSADSPHYFRLAAESAQLEFDGQTATVTGTILNVGDDEAKGIIILTTLYNENGDVTGFAKHLPSGSLLPGEELTYKRSFIPAGSIADDFNVQIYAQRLP